MYEHGIKSEASHYRELLDIAMAPNMKIVYYETLRSRYNRFIEDAKPALPPKPVDMRLDAASDEAKDVIFGVFGAIKRGYGYGR